MPQPTTARAGKMRILLGNGATPEVFAAPCGLTTKGLQVTKNLSEEAIPDCDDPDAAMWLARDVSTLSCQISGEGLLAAESEDIWTDAAFGTEPVNARVEIEFSTGTRVFAGAFHVDSYSPNSERGGRVKASISMQSDGIIAPSWTPRT